MSLSKLSPECEKCAYVRWCPSKRMVAMMELPYSSSGEIVGPGSAVRVDNVNHYRADLDGLIENLQEELARFYGVPKCFFGKTQ